MTDTHQFTDAPAPTPRSSLDVLQYSADQIFANCLNPNLPWVSNNAEILDSSDYLLLQNALVDLQSNPSHLQPEQEGNLEFILGREDYTNQKIQSALAHYQNCLKIWESSDKIQSKNRQKNSHPSPDLHTHLKYQGIVFFEIGLCYKALGEHQLNLTNDLTWESARQSFDKSLNIFEGLEQPEILAKLINCQGEVLQKLEAWSELQSLAQRALELHILHGSEAQLAQDYGFLAEAALHTSKWVHANQLAQLAVAIENQSVFKDFDEQKSYLLLLEESQKQLQEWQTTIKQLEAALQKTNVQKDTHGYLHILKALHKLYFDQGQYRNAAQIQQDILKIEYQYQIKPFVGIIPLQPKESTPESSHTIAPEIIASGRLEDVNQLVARIQNPEQKLIVIHGQSGVGKSSLINGGLIPALLEPKDVSEQMIFPIVLRIHTDWIREPDPATWNLTSTLSNLQNSDDSNILKVLIFDQFEEFFLICKDLSQRLPFYQFLHDCLVLNSVKVMLVMRTDFLHYLLECERLTNLELSNHDILSRDVRYYLGNFPPAPAKQLITSLTQQSQFHLETALVDQLIQDLAIELDDISPIELQVLGTQLQTQDITTLSQYQQLGVSPKLTLVQQFLKTVIHDCGPENQRTAQLVFYLLTDEQGTRPLKTKTELAVDLVTDSAKLDLVLDILVASGLVLHLPDIPDDRYQLVHDYLVKLIRQQEGEMLVAELQLERDKAQRRLSQEKPDSFLEKAISSVFRWMRSD